MIPEEPLLKYRLGNYLVQIKAIADKKTQVDILSYGKKIADVLSGSSDDTDWSSLLTYVKGKNADLAKLNDDAIIEGLKNNPDLVKEIVETIINEKALIASFTVDPVEFDIPFSYERTDWSQYFLGKAISQINPVSVYSSDTHEVEAEISDLWEIYKMYGSGSTEELEEKVQDFIVDKIYGLTGPIASLREAHSVMVNIRNDNFVDRMEQERIEYINDVHAYLNNAGKDWKDINAVKDAKETVYGEHTLASSINQYADIAGVEGMSSAEIEEIMKDSLMAAFDVDLAAKRLTDKDVQGSALTQYDIEKVDPLTDKLLNVVNPCISPMVWDKESRSCVCGSGYQNEGSTCVAISCPENEVWNEEAKGCYCKQGFKRSSYGHCVPEDKVQEYQDGSGNYDDGNNYNEYPDESG